LNRFFEDSTRPRTSDLLECGAGTVRSMVVAAFIAASTFEVIQFQLSSVGCRFRQIKAEKRR